MRIVYYQTISRILHFDALYKWLIDRWLLKKLFYYSFADSTWTGITLCVYYSIQFSVQLLARTMCTIMYKVGGLMIEGDALNYLNNNQNVWAAVIAGVSWYFFIKCYGHVSSLKLV